ncbi:Hypothetical protein D9617_29g007370 [Elsinoe fawcettii]|nr:Hypothetical protein D9617_29g007370 [Elsinoe fawcettii]
MPCGANTGRRALRTVASSGKGLWITDDLLNNAINQFFCVHGHQHRRHGSHVPGPMEARKRHGKRRMGLVASHDHNSAPMLPELKSMFNFGSLFDKRPIDNRWTWRAPTAREADKSLDNTLMDAQTQAPAQALDGQRRMSECNSLEDIRELYWQTCPLGNDTILFAEAALGQLLHLLEQAAPRRVPAVSSDLLKFLQSEVNDGQSYSILHALVWVGAHDMESSHLARLRRSILHLAVNRIEKSLMSVSEMTEIVDYLCQRFRAEGQLTAKFRAEYELMLQLKVVVIDSIRESSDNLECKKLAHSLHKFFQASLSKARWIDWMQFTAQLPTPLYASCTNDVVDNLIDVARKDMTDSAGRETLTAIANRAFAAAVKLDLPWRWWNDVCMRMTVTLLHERMTESQENDVLNHWLSALRKVSLVHKKSQECSEVLSMVEQVLRQFHLDPLLTLELSASEQVVTEQAESTVDIPEKILVANWSNSPQIATALVRYHIANDDVWRAKWAFDRSVRAKLSKSKELLSALVAHGHDFIGTYMELLKRPDVMDVGRTYSRGRRSRRITIEKVHTVENLAMQVSMSESILDRRALRLTWALYKYLLDRGVEISARMTRALVRAGIIRYLSHDAIIRDYRTARIIQLVKEAEGEKSAQMLEAVVVQWQRVIEEKGLSGEISRHPLQQPYQGVALGWAGMTRKEAESDFLQAPKPQSHI